MHRKRNKVGVRFQVLVAGRQAYQAVDTAGQVVDTAGQAVGTAGQVVDTPGQAVGRAGQAVDTPGQVVGRAGRGQGSPQVQAAGTLLAAEGAGRPPSASGREGSPARLMKKVPEL